MINQVQLLFLLPLTRAYIPGDILAVINGPKIVVNPFENIEFRNSGIFKSNIEKFNLKLSKPDLESFEIESDSTL